MINWILSLLVEKKVLKESDAKELAKEFELMTYSHNFDDALKDVRKLLDTIESK